MGMTQVNLSEQKKLDERLTRLELIVGKIAEKVLDKNGYGTDTWWEKEINVALKEYKKGLGKVIGSKRELNEFLDKLEAANEN